MDDQMTLVVGISLLALLCLVASWAIWKGVKKHRARMLQEKFGSEYDTARERYGRQADTELQERIKRVHRLNLRALTREQSERFGAAWRGALERFIDDPALAVAEADRLVMDVLETRGYPMADFDRRAADISVDHPLVAQDYRIAHSIARKSKMGQATTEEMRESMVHFRTVFQDLLAVTTPELQEVHS